jgi:anthranilate phosphoribosyltransferase
VRTVFNVLGPMVNPALVRRQVLGVPDAALAGKMAAVLQRLGHRHALVVTGADGMDELGVAGAATVHEVRDGGVAARALDPATLHLKPAPADALRGADPASSAQQIRRVLEGADGAPRDVVTLNAAAALVVGGVASDFADGIERARESIDSGAAKERLRRLVEISADYAQ